MNRYTPPTSSDSSQVPGPAGSARPSRTTTVSRRGALGLGLALGGAAALPGGAALAAPGDGELPVVRPRPSTIEPAADGMNLRGRVTIIVGQDTDPAALAALEALLDRPGGPVDVVTATDASTTVGGHRIHLGTPQDNPTVAPALAALGIDGPDDLAADGYVLVTGRDRGPVAVLAGRDARGTYYAVQTLRRLLAGTSRIPAVRVRDEPLMEIRGAIEGFYGIPWSHQARLDHFAFHGAHKLNTYIYTPKDDLLLRSKWRELYEGEELARLAELVETANAHHVSFTYALSPGNDITYGSDADFEATVTKFDQLRELGVTSFYIALDDIPTDLGEEDAARFDSLAAAQVHYLNRVQSEYVDANGLDPLQTVPTHYAGSDPSDYKTAFGTGADPGIRIQWTGEGVFSPSITEESVARAVASYHTDHLYIWDNFPVNDGRRDRLFLNPLEGRDASLHELLAGFTSNPMIQPYASLIALANYADYCWNPPAYDPGESWEAVLDELAGADEEVRAALRVFADLNQNWPYREGSPSAPELGADIEDFWADYEAGHPGGQDLRDRLHSITGLDDVLASMAHDTFHQDTRPWIIAAGHWADGLLAQVEMLIALTEDRPEDASAAAARVGDHLAAAGEATVPDQGADGVYREDQIVPTVGDGRFETFVARAWEELRAVLPDDPSLPFRGLPGTATTTIGTYQDHLPARMIDGDLSTFYWSSRAPRTGDEVRIELEESHPIGFVRVQMARSDDTAGDQIHDGVLELSADGDSWTRIGAATGDPVAEVTLEDPVEARYGRLRVTGPNPGGQWVQVREFGLAEEPPAQ